MPVSDNSYPILVAAVILCALRVTKEDYAINASRNKLMVLIMLAQVNMDAKSAAPSEYKFYSLSFSL